jgi:di/tricarboxylate transporter
VNCVFDLAHYAELVEAARAGGYRFAYFAKVGGLISATVLVVTSAMVTVLG